MAEQLTRVKSSSAFITSGIRSWLKEERKSTEIEKKSFIYVNIFHKYSMPIKALSKTYIHAKTHFVLVYTLQTKIPQLRMIKHIPKWICMNKNFISISVLSVLQVIIAQAENRRKNDFNFGRTPKAFFFFFVIDVFFFFPSIHCSQFLVYFFSHFFRRPNLVALVALTLWHWDSVQRKTVLPLPPSMSSSPTSHTSSFSRRLCRCYREYSIDYPGMWGERLRIEGSFAD